MNLRQLRALGTDLADAVVGEVPIHADTPLLEAIALLGSALVKAEGSSDESAAIAARELPRAFAVRAQRLVEGLK